VAASSKIVSLVLFSEQNFGQRMDFGNFGRYEAWRRVLRDPHKPRDFWRQPASAEALPPGKILFLETVNKATELKALSHYFNPFGDMCRGSAGGPFHVDKISDGALFHAPGRCCGMASMRRFSFAGIIKLYH
jgi:hypothetical protein